MSEFDNPALTEPPYREVYTDRLKLRTLRVSDAERLMPILTSRDVMQWTTEPLISNTTQAERWISDRALGQDVFNFIIEFRQPDLGSPDTPIIGIAGTFHLPKIGYLIHPSQWGKGIASEALRALVPAIFERFLSVEQANDDAGLDYVEGWVDVENVASRRVLEKCGFVVCKEVDAPADAPRGAGRVAVLRRARVGRDLREMGLMGGREGDGRGDGGDQRLVPPVE